MSYILVGVDDSDGAQRAFGWAAEEARIRGLPLHALTAYVPLETLYPYAVDDLGAGLSADDNARHARERAEELLDEVIDTHAGALHGVEVQRVVTAERPAHALIDRSRDAELLVVGSRGRGGFAGLLLGSVSQQCVHHAHCPVVVVPPRRAKLR